MTTEWNASGRGLSETERETYLKLADALHELGNWQAENLPPDFDTRTCWSTTGWKWGAELKQFVQDYDRSLQVANEVIGQLQARVAELEKPGGRAVHRSLSTEQR